MTAEDAFDRELVAALRRREPAAFAAAFDRYADRIFRLALGLLGDELEADGIVQETFVRLFQKLDSFEGRSSLGTWLYRVAYNLSLDHLRKRRPDLTIDDEEDQVAVVATTVADWGRLPEEALSNEEVREALDQAIAALPEHYRVVFILREIEGLPSLSPLQFLDASQIVRTESTQTTFVEAGRLPGLDCITDWCGHAPVINPTLASALTRARVVRRRRRRRLRRL